MRAAFIWALTALTVVQAKVSNTGKCGATNGGLVCTGSTYGDCCSQHGWCGTTSDYCGVGCDPSHGSCQSSSAPAKKVSTDGTCGGSKGYTCQGSKFGSCCSQHNWCGNADSYCGTGCNSAFGSCSNAGGATSLTKAASSTSRAASSTIKTSTIATASPSSLVKISTDGRCGYAYGATGGFSCPGSKFGDCCSQYSYCGSTKDYCDKGCQAGFGKCSPGQSSSSSVRSSSSTVQSSSVALSAPSSTVVASSTSMTSSNTFTSTSESSSSAASFNPMSSSSALSSPEQSPSVAASSTPISSSATTSLASSSSLSELLSTQLTVLSSTSASSTSAPSASTSGPVDSVSEALSSQLSSSSFTLTSSVTLIAPSAPSSPPTESCSSTNYMSNGGFEKGTTDGFTITTTAASVSILDSGGYSGTHLARGILTSIARSNVDFQQSNIMIPSGTTVNVFAFIRSLSGATQRFTIFLDDQSLANIVTANGNWNKISTSSSYTVVGDSHTLRFSFQGSVGAPAYSPLFDLDDISIVSVPVCATPSSSAASATSTPTFPSTLSVSASASLSSSSSTASVLESQSGTSTTTPIFASSEVQSSAFSTSLSSSLIPSSDSQSSTLEVVVSPTSTPTSTPTPTPPANPSAACIAASTNYLVNPGFETSGGITPWRNGGLTGPWQSLAKSTAATHSGSYGFNMVTYNSALATVYVVQSGVVIPDGTQIVASAWINLSRSPPTDGAPFTFTLYLNSGSGDRVLLTTTLAGVQASAGWMQLTSDRPITVVGSTHDFKFYVSTQGYQGQIAVLDDLVLTSCSSDSIISSSVGSPSTSTQAVSSSSADPSNTPTTAVSSSSTSSSSYESITSVATSSSVASATTASATLSPSESSSVAVSSSVSVSSTSVASSSLVGSATSSATSSPSERSSVAASSSLSSSSTTADTSTSSISVSVSTLSSSAFTSPVTPSPTTLATLVSSIPSPSSTTSSSSSAPLCAPTIATGGQIRNGGFENLQQPWTASASNNAVSTTIFGLAYEGCYAQIFKPTTSAATSRSVTLISDANIIPGPIHVLTFYVGRRSFFSGSSTAVVSARVNLPAGTSWTRSFSVCSGAGCNLSGTGGTVWKKYQTNIDFVSGQKLPIAFTTTWSGGARTDGSDDVLIDGILIS